MELFPEPSTPSVTRLCEMQPGEVGICFVVLAAKERGKTRDGKPYYRAIFRDSGRTATAMIWSDGGLFADCEQAWQAGRFYKVRCIYAENQYGPQIDIDRIREATEEDRGEGFDPGEFFERSRFDPDEMFDELTGLAESNIDDEPLRQLVLELLEVHAEPIKSFPAASRNHHAFQSGFLEHVLSVTRTAVYLAEKYRDYYTGMQPPLSKSLVTAGAILHDIGKLIELDGRPEGAGYTPPGRLIGHILLGRDMVREKAATVDGLDPELLLRLEHIIVAHQNLPEWGSPIAPHTPEALLVYFADDIDAKFHMMARALESEPIGDDLFTPRDNPLRRAIFRGDHLTGGLGNTEH
ncbi:MAG: HD domain-containing protein [Planctomycetota bacterium]|nr:MAG: HD domain-containing protein [Planctomycetota bacterium]REJ91275.1 MAG: HD domain-containing protein [Planctomycetota bacterium]REK28895.1 MAG: HD domain-containing protein [Planctomycetota bacterium]REK39671.1 MAG: HD domain-containing protein [Planctomycetota bacterium]